VSSQLFWLVEKAIKLGVDALCVSLLLLFRLLPCSVSLASPWPRSGLIFLYLEADAIERSSTSSLRFVSLSLRSLPFIFPLPNQNDAPLSRSTPLATIPPNFSSFHSPKISRKISTKLCMD
jgi:hypothetical protein